MNQIPQPVLNEGEIFIGSITKPDGTTIQSILLPGDTDDITWDAAMALGKELGGDLPNRIEQAILFDMFKDEFKERWYWSNTQRASLSDYAWFQSFDIGGQIYDGKTYECRARFVRRLIIQ